MDNLETISCEEAVGYMGPHLEALRKQVEIKTILDIGAAHGHFSKFALRYWPEAKVTAVECSEVNSFFLDPTNWNVHYACLGDKPCKKTFYVNPLDLHGGGSSFYKENTKHFNKSDEIEKDIVTLDSLELLPHDLIKIDVQGAELDVMKGGEETIKQAKYLLLELSFVEFNKDAPLIDDILEYTRSIGFRMIDTFGPQFGGHWWEGRKIQTDVLLAKDTESIFQFTG